MVETASVFTFLSLALGTIWELSCESCLVLWHLKERLAHKLHLKFSLFDLLSNADSMIDVGTFVGIDFRDADTLLALLPLNDLSIVTEPLVLSQMVEPLL